MGSPLSSLSPYRKAIASFAAGALTWGTAVVASDSSNITASEWIELAGVAVATLLVYLIPNQGAADAVQGEEVGQGVQGGNQDDGANPLKETPVEGEGQGPG